MAAQARQKAIANAIDEKYSVRTMLNVSLVRGKGLPSAEKGKPSPCCTCQLEGRPYTRLKSEVIKNTMSPVWNHTGMIDGCVNGDTLEFAVFNARDETLDDCLGRAVLAHSQFHPDGFSGEIPLTSTKGKLLSKLEVTVEVLPVPVTAPKELRAFISFISAEELAGNDLYPYCICEIPGKPDSKVRSKICDLGSNPVWNELHEIEDYAAGDQLQFTVCSQKDAAQREEFLGAVVFPSSAFHGCGFAGKAHLAGEDAAGAITVCIDIGGVSRDPNRQLEPDDYLPDTIRLDKTHTGILPLEDGRVSSSQSKRMPRRVNASEPGLKVSPITPTGAAQRHSVASSVADIGRNDRQPAPFQLRSLDTDRVHRLCAYTMIGRSKTQLDPDYDLILDSPGICDVSRVHAVIRAWQGADARAWSARVFDEKTGRGFVYDEEGYRQLVGGGTSVDGEPVDSTDGTEIGPGSVLRFGVNELWVVETAPLHQRLRSAEMACRQAQDAEDPESIRELTVPSFSCDSALHRCGDWISIVQVVLEACNEPDEAPCADCIEVKDESGRPVSRHLAMTLEQQEAYDVKRILQDVRLGTTVRLRLSSDPLLLAPVLGHVEQVKSNVEELYRSRAHVLS